MISWLAFANRQYQPIDCTPREVRLGYPETGAEITCDGPALVFHDRGCWENWRNWAAAEGNARLVPGMKGLVMSNIMKLPDGISGEIPRLCGLQRSDEGSEAPGGNYHPTALTP